ncbi:MAG: extracellular solute-binding protein [Chloroflexi bacterium]|nr:extracellular solute-binding protein [Chloroflexota bacterium]
MKRSAALSILCLVLLISQLLLAGCAAAPTPTLLPAPTATAVPAPAATKAPAPTVAPTTAAAPAASVTGDLVMVGAVEKALGLKEADLRGMKVVKITAEHPKSGSAEYEGVRLSDLFALAKPTAAATKLVFTAADGFSAEVDLAAIRGCADCMVAFTNTPGKLKLAMPALPSNLWVKDVNKIEFSTQPLAAAPTKAPEPTKAAAPTATITPVVRKSGTLLLATTTSTADTGLLTAILPIFEKANNCKVDFVAVGSGQAIEIGRKGDADVLLVHSRAAEDKFVADGFAKERFDVMYNDFVVVGPKEDPAKITGMSLAKDAFKAIMDKAAPFASRGDGSGTQTKEKAIWASLSVTPTKEMKWYNSLGQGMGDTLLFSNEQKAYTLADRGTWLAMKDKTPNLALLIGGANLAENKDKDLLNPYGLLAVSPDKFPSVNNTLAMKFIEWMTSDEGQKLVGSFGADKFGQPLFYPSAKK